MDVINFKLKKKVKSVLSFENSIIVAFFSSKVLEYSVMFSAYYKYGIYCLWGGLQDFCACIFFQNR